MLITAIALSATILFFSIIILLGKLQNLADLRPVLLRVQNSPFPLKPARRVDRF